jgi:tetratricopeptide (TPR) repeat protein
VIKGWQSRRLASEAFALIDQRKWSEANAKARDAYFLRPTEPESWRAIARLGSRRNQWPSALQWWKKVDESGRLTIEDRRDYVAAALATGEVTLASKQAQVLVAQRAPAAVDLMWAGQVASRESNPVLALDYAQRALADKGAKPYEVLSASTLILSVTSPYSTQYARAWKQLEDVARDSKNPGSLDALTVLANEQALPPMPAPGGNELLSLENPSQPKPASQESTISPGTPEVTTPTDVGNPPGSTPAAQSSDGISLNLGVSPPSAAGRTMSLTEVANALENHPYARPFHKLLALEVRARQDPILADQYVSDAIERFGKASHLAQTYQGGSDLADETLAALAGWLNKIGRPAKTLEVLSLERAGQQPDLLQRYLDALSALQRWNDIKSLLLSERFPIEPMLQHMYLAVAQTHLGSATGATNEWQRALEVANTSEKAMTLAKYAEGNSAKDTADAAYYKAIKIAPKDRGGYDGRLRLALAAGHTAEAQTIAAEIARLWPDDANARNQNEYLQLLLGASDDFAHAAERDAQVLVAMEPRNWPARATLGLARLHLGRKRDALTAIREPLVTGVEPPGPLAVRVAILAANGYEEGARNDALLTSAKPLLPEERALIAPLLQ